MKKQLLLKPLLALVFVMMCGSVCGAATYKLVQVTEVAAGNYYVFEQDGHVMINTVSSSALQTTSNYNTTGLVGSETYVWKLTKATNGFYISSDAINKYITNSSSTSISLGTSGSDFTFSFTDGVALISNSNNSDRFLGYTTETSYAYKAYATSNLNGYSHAIKVYKLVVEEGTGVDATGVTLQKDLELGIGNTATLQATIAPSDATNKNVTWSSSNESVATVDVDGVVTGITAGTAIITVTTEDGGFTASCAVTVNTISVTGVSLDKTTAAVTIGRTITLVATVTPEEATNKNVTWSSKNESVATVENGVVTGIAAGTATITVMTEDGTKKAECEVTVSEPGEEMKLTIDFESDLSTYTAWDFTNIQKGSTDITAHGGSNYGTTGGKTTCSIQTSAKVAKPLSIAFFISKQSTNTTSSTWHIKVSEDGKNWTDVKSESATSMNKGEWEEVSQDLSSYSNVYVRIEYDGTAAVRNIDDITFVAEAPKVAVPVLDSSCTFEGSKVITITDTTEDATIYYSVNGGNEVVYTDPFTVTATSTVVAYAKKGADKSESVTAIYTRIDFSSLAALATADVASGTVVKVTFENVKITEIYVSGGQYRNGVYVDVKGKNDNNIEIYYNNVPVDWIVGGTLSGTMTCPWTYYEKGGVWELAPTKDSWDWNNLTYAAPSFDVPISTAKYATLCLPFSFTVPTGVTAYTGAATNAGVTLTAIDGVVPANTGVILYSETAGTYTFTGSAETPATLGTNNLVGVTAATTVPEGSYILALDNTDNTAKFFEIDPTDNTLAANKAYLTIPSGVTPSKALAIRRGDATGIENIKKTEQAVYIDLMGRKVANPTPGIYILDGKKVLVK